MRVIVFNELATNKLFCPKNNRCGRYVKVQWHSRYPVGTGSVFTLRRKLHRRNIITALLERCSRVYMRGRRLKIQLSLSTPFDAE
jgi:hypothetical protein